MRAARARLGLRGRLAISIGVVVVLAYAAVFGVVRAEMSHESAVIRREEAREDRAAGAAGDERASAVSPIADAHSDVEKTFLLVGAGSLIAALLAGYLLAARTASPLRRFAATAAEVSGGNLTPRLEVEPSAAVELRALADAFNHMLDRLDAAFARQRRFVSDASHELRSPLTAVRGQLEVLALGEQVDMVEMRRVKTLALSEVARIERLIEDLLACARLDEGEKPHMQELEPARFLIDLAVGDAKADRLTGGRLTADPDLLARVVRNLFENARRHAGPGGCVELGSTEVEAGVLLIYVDDDGPGIAPSERERVFDRFYRSEAARDRASGGSGLGLAISCAIVAAHGGRIWVEDSPLGGARVCFAVPRFESSVRTA
jgi:two-component system, OmpR family, sensor kinase